MTTTDTNMRNTTLNSNWNWVQPATPSTPPVGYTNPQPTTPPMPGSASTGVPPWAAPNADRPFNTGGMGPGPSSVHAQALPPRTAEIKAANRARAMSEIFYGLMMIVIGVAITVGTIMMNLPIFVVSWGPVVFGTVRVVKGFKLLATG